MADRCLRTVLISWMVAPLRSSCVVTALRSAIEIPSAGSDSRLEPRPESSLPAARASGRRERFLRCVGAEAVELRIGLAERLLDLLDRHVGVAAAVAQVLHVAAVVRVEGMEDRIAAPVELERLDAKPGAQC